MYGIIVILLRASFVYALANDIDLLPERPSNELQASLNQVIDNCVDGLISRVLKASTVPYLSKNLEDIREQIDNVKALVETGEFSRAEDLLRLVESSNLRKDVAVAETLTLAKPGSKLFDLAEVVEPLIIVESAVSRAAQMEPFKNQWGLTAPAALANNVLFNLDRLQTGIGNVEEALKSIHGKSREHSRFLS